MSLCNEPVSLNLCEKTYLSLVHFQRISSVPIKKGYNFRRPNLMAFKPADVLVWRGRKGHPWRPIKTEAG